MEGWAGPSTLDYGDFVIPKMNDPLMGYDAVYVIGGKARLATVEACYRDCPFQGLNVVPFALPEKFFAMPKRVFPGTALDEDFPAIMAAGARGPENPHTSLQPGHRRNASVSGDEVAALHAPSRQVTQRTQRKKGIGNGEVVLVRFFLCVLCAPWSELVQTSRSSK